MKESDTMTRLAIRRKAAADRAKVIANEYGDPEPCGCDYCNPYRHARAHFTKLARELNDPNGMSGTDIWIAWRERGRQSYW